MSKITLHKENENSTTTVSNRFIDEYMTNANGEFVKIYLYLLRCMNAPDCSFSISRTADKFEHTEKDVQRALKYWEKMNLLRLEYDKEKNISSIYFTDSVSIPKLPNSPTASADTGKNAAQVARNAQADFNATDDRNVQADFNATNARNVQADFNATNARNVQADFNATNARNVQADFNAMDDRNAPADLTAMDNRNTPADFITQTADMPAAEHITAPAYAPPKAAAAPSRPATSPKRQYSASDIHRFQEKEDIQELMFVTESYLGHPLTQSDIQTLLSWYDDLEFSADVIIYLIEYGITKGHKSLHYMDKVAMSWKDADVKTVEDAKQNVSSYGKIHYAVMKALGINGRNLVSIEMEYIDKWTKDLGYGLDLISEACSRTILAVHKPDFKYTDKILTNWHTQKVCQLSDVLKLDAQRQKEQAAAKAAGTGKSASSNKFNNFPQRSYDLEKLESQLLNTTH